MEQLPVAGGAGGLADQCPGDVDEVDELVEVQQVAQQTGRAGSGRGESSGVQTPGCGCVRRFEAGEDGPSASECAAHWRAKRAVVQCTSASAA
ncbi:hypothetical protein ABT187_42220 [Streptomyces sp. NPDC001817]|uniref:hypothetical protein n=1 Tax=Streptomyces sp. NPDC001817 TaxID=3154398 RepID=UPI00332DA3CE